MCVIVADSFQTSKLLLPFWIHFVLLNILNITPKNHSHTTRLVTCWLSHTRTPTKPNHPAAFVHLHTNNSTNNFSKMVLSLAAAANH